MFGVKTRFDSLPAVVAFVTVLLVGLAFLQYRWTGELSEAEGGRLRASLHDRAAQMARELDREVTRAFLWLSVDAETLRSGDYSRFAERYDRWRAQAMDPGLVKEIYLLRAEGDSEPGPLLYSPERRTFEPAAWPPAIAAARERFLGEIGERRRSPGEPSERRPRAFFGPLELLEDGTPIGRMPTPSFERRPGPAWERGTPPEGPGPERGPRGPGPRPEGPSFNLGVTRLSGFFVVVFDRDTIVSRILPRLAARHFPDHAESGFALTVERRDRPGEVVYRTPGGPGKGADARTGLLELRFEEASEEDLRAVSGPFGGRPDGRRPPPDRRGPGGRFFRARGPEQDGLWVLAVAYRGGSVDALVAAARRRNLAVSFSVLLLLGAATVLLASAARHARRMAERQMEFVAAVSHELRTPVSVICSAGENLADGVVTGPAGVTRYGALVRDEGRRLARLIEQILDFAGSYTGRRSYRREPVAAGQVIDEALAAALPFVKDAGFQVAREDTGSLPEIRGDAPALARAVRNLVENAVKYGGEDRTVRVRTSATQRAGRPFVRIEVEDKGLGIPAGEQKQLFEPFWRGAEATSRQIRGSGLGLALVRSIARAHGGEVTVRSQHGSGSVFAMELPAAEGLPPEPLAAASETRETHSSGAKSERDDDIAHSAG